MDAWNIYRWRKSANPGCCSHGKIDGIWEMSADGVESDYIQIAKAEQEHGLMGDHQGSHICRIYPAYGELGRQKAEANARLIAAAPKMLFALQKVLPYVADLNTENFEDANAGIFKDHELEKAYMTILSAIAHATNEDAKIGLPV